MSLPNNVVNRHFSRVSPQTRCPRGWSDTTDTYHSPSAANGPRLAVWERRAGRGRCHFAGQFCVERRDWQIIAWTWYKWSVDAQIRLKHAKLTPQTHGGRWFDAWIREVRQYWLTRTCIGYFKITNIVTAQINSDNTFDVEYTDGHKPRLDRSSTLNQNLNSNLNVNRFESAVPVSRLRHKAVEPNCVVQWPLIGLRTMHLCNWVYNYS